MDAPSLASVISTICNVGFSAVVAWYLLTKALPRNQEIFTAELKEIRTIFQTEIDTVRNRHDERELVWKADHKDALDALIVHYEKESSLHDERIKIDLKLVTDAIHDQREVLEEVRDELRNVCVKTNSLSP